MHASCISIGALQPIWLAEPALSADERDWLYDIGTMPPTPGAMPYWVDVVRDPMQGPSTTLPCHVPVCGTQLTRGFVNEFRAKTRRRLGRGRSAGPSAPRRAGVNLVRGG